MRAVSRVELGDRSDGGPAMMKDIVNLVIMKNGCVFQNLVQLMTIKNNLLF